MFWKSTSLRGLNNNLTLRIYQNLGIRYKLKYFIQTNKLYLVEDVKEVKKENGERVIRNRIQKSVKIKWFIKKNEFEDKILTCRLLKDGSILDRLMYDKASELEALFGSELMERKNKISYVEFVLLWKKNNKDKDVYFLDRETKENKAGYVQINKYCKWDYICNPHCLISGSSGSGKTYLLLSIVHKLMSETVKDNIYICDGKFDELRDTALYFNLSKIANNEEEIRNYIEEVSVKMDEAYKQKKKIEPIFLILDEFASLQLVMDKKEFQAINSKVKNIVLKGRRLGVNVIVAMQRASSDSIDLAIRDNLSFRVGLGNLSSENFKMIFNIVKNNDEIKTFDEVGKGYCSINGCEPFRFDSPVIYLKKDSRSQDF